MASTVVQAGRTVQRNPATTTGSVGIVVAIIGRWIGWDEQTQLDIVTLFLLAVPAVRAAAYWWEHRNDEP